MRDDNPPHLPVLGVPPPLPDDMTQLKTLNKKKISDIMSLFKKNDYDLDSLEGILSIEIPKYKPKHGLLSPENNIEYILQRKATEHKRNGRMDLAIACLRKSNEIFPYSNFLWSRNDYMRLVEFLKQDGQFEEARAEEKRINGIILPTTIADACFEITLMNCKSMKTDLIESSENIRECAVCAMYTRRIFSISGKDKRFPVLPDFFRMMPREHDFCLVSFYPFLLNFSEPTWEFRGNLFDWSNRPYKDERSSQQKEYYRDWVISNLQESLDRENYDFIREYLPEVAPKSFGGYRRMKNMRSTAYKKIRDLTLSLGVDLDQLPDHSIYHF